MLSKNTTSAGTFILLGLSTLASSASSDIYKETSIYNSSDLYAFELEYNAPEELDSRIDSYVKSFYKYSEDMTTVFNTLEYGFLNAIQMFSQEQVEIESDFLQVMNELFDMKAKSKPTKKRF
jgi:hypothetical protein